MHFVGVDGCSAGWLAIALDDNGAMSFSVEPEFGVVASRFHRGLILVDIPIGLRDEGATERLCDLAARKVLGARASSVFPAPCRTALDKPDYPSASLENAERTGRKLNKQTWELVPKLRQVDEFLRLHSSEGPVIREIHPEVCFWGLAGRAMEHSKHRSDGVAERLAILNGIMPGSATRIRDLVASGRRADFRIDDALDALAAATTAFRGAETLETLPKFPETDSRGLRMEMAYARLSSA